MSTRPRRQRKPFITAADKIAALQASIDALQPSTNASPSSTQQSSVALTRGAQKKGIARRIRKRASPETQNAQDSSSTPSKQRKITSRQLINMASAIASPRETALLSPEIKTSTTQNSTFPASHGKKESPRDSMSLEPNSPPRKTVPTPGFLTPSRHNQGSVYKRTVSKATTARRSPVPVIDMVGGSESEKGPTKHSSDLKRSAPATKASTHLTTVTARQLTTKSTMLPKQNLSRPPKRKEHSLLAKMRKTAIKKHKVRKPERTD